MSRQPDDPAHPALKPGQSGCTGVMLCRHLDKLRWTLGSNGADAGSISAAGGWGSRAGCAGGSTGNVDLQALKLSASISSMLSSHSGLVVCGIGSPPGGSLDLVFALAGGRFGCRGCCSHGG